MTLTFRTDRLRAVRKKRGFTQDELAQACGLGLKQINRYENGASEPTAMILATISRYLDVSMDYLCGLSDIPHSYPTLEISLEERKLLEAYSAGDLTTLVKLATDRLRLLEGE